MNPGQSGGDGQVGIAAAGDGQGAVAAAEREVGVVISGVGGGSGDLAVGEGVVAGGGAWGLDRAGKRDAPLPGPGG